MDLNNSNILLTGGSLGIGKAAAKLLVDSGANVAITGRDENRLNKAAGETGAIPIIADVANEQDIEKTYRQFLDKFKRLDCLINNAGIGGNFPLLENLQMQDLESVFRVNVFGAAMMASKAAALFKKQNYGHIINIGSTSALKGGAHSSVYSATKFALRSMTQSWQAELRKFNVLYRNCLCGRQIRGKHTGNFSGGINEIFGIFFKIGVHNIFYFIFYFKCVC
ncbi:MAG: SDR family NAD(P)-dependent oxidoreductase [Calditrichaceae bacterium]